MITTPSMISPSDLQRTLELRQEQVVIRLCFVGPHVFTRAREPSKLSIGLLWARSKSTLLGVDEVDEGILLSSSQFRSFYAAVC